MYLDLSFRCAKVFHWVPLIQLQGKQAAENEKNRKIGIAKVKSYFKCNLKHDRESTRDKIRLFQVVELQKRRHLPSTDNCEGREETKVIQDGPKETVRDWPCRMLHRRVVSTEEMKTKKKQFDRRGRNQFWLRDSDRLLLLLKVTQTPRSLKGIRSLTA